MQFCAKSFNLLDVLFSVRAPYRRTVFKQRADHWEIGRGLCVLVAYLLISSRKSQHAVCLFVWQSGLYGDFMIGLAGALHRDTSTLYHLSFPGRCFSGSSPWQLKFLNVRFWSYCTYLDGKSCSISFPMLQFCWDRLGVWCNLLDSWSTW